MGVIQILGSGVVAFSVGAVIGYFGRQFFASKQMETAEGKVSKIISDAKDKAAEILLDSKNKAVKILDDVKNEEIERNRQVYRNEQRVIKKEEGLEQKYSEIEKQKTILQDKAKQVMTIKEEVEKIKGEQIVKLEKVAQLDQDDAKNILIKKVEEDQKVDILKRMKQLEEEGAEDLQKRANDIIVQSIQKYSGSHTAETTTSTVSLPSDEMKGRIIGREGRNIKTLEKATGVETIIDYDSSKCSICGDNTYSGKGRCFNCNDVIS